MPVLRTIAIVFICAGSARGQQNAQSSSATTQAMATSIVGKVADSAGTPLAGAEVRLVVADSEVAVARTDDAGLFVAVGVVNARTILRVRRIGFHAREVELFFPRDSTRVLVIELDANALESAGVGVQDTAQTSTGWPQEFHDRRRSSSIGYFFTRRDIMSRQPQFVSEVLRVIPGIRLEPSRRGGFTLRIRGCQYAPVVWINRLRARRADELDNVARIDDVEALEVYTSPAGVPAQYLDRSNMGCGTIIVWTRHQ